MADVLAWKCEVCGYIHEGAEPAQQCPICGASRDLFERLDIPAARSAKPVDASLWRCAICDHEHLGDAPPEICPVCATPGNLFAPIRPDAAIAPQSSSGPIAIVGAGIAGLTAAQRARATAPDLPIVLISDEPGVPYYRLNLTRLLAKEVRETDLEIFPKTWFEAQRIEIVTGDVSGIEPENGRITLSSGLAIPFAKLVLANGAHPFVPPFAGASKRGVHVLRTVEHARRIAQSVRSGARCVCIGGGLLGLETAGALLRSGAAVTVVESYGWLLSRQLPEPAGRLLERHVESLGIQIKRQAKVKEIGGDDRARAVVLENGEELPVDLVVISAGVRPNSYLARQAHIKVGKGILVDDRMFTSLPNVLAAGDVAEHRGECHGIWPVAYAQGAVAGINAAGGEAEYQGMPRSNRLKVMDVDLFSIGQVNPSDGGDDVFEEQTDARYKRLILRDGRVMGAVLFGDTALASAVKAAVESGRQMRESAELLGVLKQWARPAGQTAGARLETINSTAEDKTMPSIKGTQTEKNLLKAFAGESQARNRYTYAAGVARKAGFLQIADIFQETADNEKEHAKVFFKFLEGGPLEITATYPAGKIDDTLANLEAAAAGEHEEWTELYPTFAEVAKKEGFKEVSAAFAMISKVEKEHEERYRTLASRVKTNTVYKREQKTRWKCANCGYVHEGPEAPQLCPACKHAQNHFEVKAENY